MERAVLEVGHSGDWMPVEQLREAAINVLRESRDVAIDLNGLNHLDASALQVLLALETEQQKRGRQLDRINVSSSLQQWFDYSGAVGHFFENAQKHDA